MVNFNYHTGQRRQNIFITEERFFGQHQSTVSLLTLQSDVWHLLDVLQWLPITLNHLLLKKSTDLTMTYNIMWLQVPFLCVTRFPFLCVTKVSCCAYPVSLCPLHLSHSFQASASLIFLKCTKHGSSSEPLHLLFPLPWTTSTLNKHMAYSLTSLRSLLKGPFPTTICVWF